MSVNSELGNLVRLGDYIEEVVLKLGENNHIEISGINLEHGFIPTVADMTGIDKSKYKLVPVDCFACNLMHIGRDIKIPIAYNDTGKNIAVSPAYYVFKIRENNKNDLLGYYLEILLTRNEFGRLAWFHTDSSIRGNLLTSELNDIRIPLPDIDIQQELVDTHNGLKALAEQNEALIKPLTEACQAYIVDCKKKYSEVELGEYIEPSDERNIDNKYTLEDVRGISILKKLIPTKADMMDVSLFLYKILKPLEFSYVTVTSRNGGKISLAINDSDQTHLVSSSYEVFKSKNTEELLPKYLYLSLSREEFDRFSRFNSWGSARETFDWSELCRVRIPLPPPEIQQAIVNLYNCAEEAKNIAAEAREKIKTLCPALVQRAING
ncbi:restriction endonuclease subunit S [Phocaeicola sp.]|uniref:restriction endonuclease subunit S n=1 Tax=Phocaeicola sp. TaxID=2773926 RepID=UPI003A949356